MRTVATLALALALLTIPAPLGAGPTPVAAQDADDQPEDDDGGEQAELSFTSNCLQLRCQFEAIDPDAAVGGNASSIEWTFDPDGATASGNPVVHTFEQPGTYEVQLTVMGNATENGTLQANATDEVSVVGQQIPWEALALGLAAVLGAIVLARMT